jgi:predicted nucleotidyltransferase
MALSKQERDVLTLFRDLLKAGLAQERPEVALFGSKARGDDRPDSDVDVLVRVNSDDWRVCDKIYAVATRLLLDTGVCISPKVVSRALFDRMKRDGMSFAGNIMKDAVAI